MDKATGEGTLTTRWGVADDGAMVHVSVPATAAGRLDERWPPMGLTRGEEAGPSPDLVVVLRPGVAGTLLVEVRLCIAAAEEGAVVLSDEYALVDAESGLVRGWQRAVRLRRPDGGVDRLNLARPTDPMPVGLVALVGFQPGGALAIEDLAPAKAALGLLANTVCAQSRPQESLDAALRIARSCSAVGGTRGEATEAIRALMQRLGSQ